MDLLIHDPSQCLSGGRLGCQPDLTLVDVANFFELPTLDEMMVGESIYVEEDHILGDRAVYDYSFKFGASYCTQEAAVIFQEMGDDMCTVASRTEAYVDR